MELELRINGIIESLDVAPNDSLMAVLRREGYFSVKHGCETGECGACTVLVDGQPRPSCVMLAAQAGGCTLLTVESLGSGYKLHPLQDAFIDTGAIQCGFCTPGMLLSAFALLRRNSNPTEDEVRDALSGNLCRCTGYVKPVQAVLRAAAIMRGEPVDPVGRPVSRVVPQFIEGNSLLENPEMEENHLTADTVSLRALPKKDNKAASTPSINRAPSINRGATGGMRVVGKPERKFDAVKLATGKPVFVDDSELRGMLHGCLLTSPHAHATIRSIDVSQARSLPGVHAVLTYKDLERLPQSGVGQEHGSRRSRFSLDRTVRFVGDRVAAVAAETSEIAEQALKLIQVEYEVLPAVLDLREATSHSAPHLQNGADIREANNTSRNIAAQVHAEVGNVERGFAESDMIIENEYIASQTQQVPIENHIAITYWDQDDRIVVRSSTEAPYHVRRVIAPLVGLPLRRIRVIKSRTGGSLSTKQGVVLEDICALLTRATNRPVKLAFSRAEEFCGGHSSHAQIIRMKTGVKSDGTILANQMMLLTNTGAYARHASDMQRNIGLQTLPLYPCPNMRFVAQAVYTNLPPAGGAYGHGIPQACFALESQMDEVARRLGIDALELRRKNWLSTGMENLLATTLSSGREGAGNRAHVVESCGLPQCLQIVEEKLNWKERRGRDNTGRFRRGVGVALAMHGITPWSRNMSAASIKLNEDGSFNLLVGTVDGGNDTLLAQVAAEVLGVRVTDIIMHSSETVDTDIVPFDSGGYTPSAISVSGNAVKSAAEQVRHQVLKVASQILKAQPETLIIDDGIITAPGGHRTTISQVALRSLYGENQQYIMASASWKSDKQSPAFAAQGAEVEVDTETGMIRILKAVSAVDGGYIINPVIAEGQIQGGAAQSLGYGICEEMVYGQRGLLLTIDLSSYRIYNAPDMPSMETYIVETTDPTGPFGSKAVSEISVDAMAAAVANAVADALGVRIRQLPLTPERILRAIHATSMER
jgi:putative selenate reductase molybdopterin-binding subunit